MNNTLHSINNANSGLISFSFFALVVLGNWVDNWYYFILVLSTALIISAIRYFHDRKWQVRAEEYIRVITVTPFWKNAIGIVLIIGLTFLVAENSLNFAQYISSKTTFSYLILAAILLLGDHHTRFVESIKSFEDGIQLPGRNQDLIPWREVYDFKVDDKVLISSSKGEQEFDIDPKDFEITHSIISVWKSKKVRNTSI